MRELTGINFISFENVREMSMTHSRPIFECLNKLSQYLKNKHLNDTNKGERLEEFIDVAECDESGGCDRCGIKMNHTVIRILRPLILKTYLRRYRDIYV